MESTEVWPCDVISSLENVVQMVGYVIDTNILEAISLMSEHPWMLEESKPCAVDLTVCIHFIHIYVNKSRDICRVQPARLNPPSCSKDELWVLT